MTAPAATMSVTDRYRLKELNLEKSNVLPSGKMMWCRDRKILAYGIVPDLENVFNIPKGANTLCLSPVDYDDVREWLG